MHIYTYYIIFYYILHIYTDVLLGPVWFVSGTQVLLAELHDRIVRYILYVC